MLILGGWKHGVEDFQLPPRLRLLLDSKVLPSLTLSTEVLFNYILVFYPWIKGNEMYFKDIKTTFSITRLISIMSNTDDKN